MKNKEKLCFITLKSDAKFEEKQTYFWFQRRHQDFGEFWPNHSKVQKLHFNGLFLSKVFEVWAKKIQRSYLSWHWTVMQNLNKPWTCGFKNGMRNWVNFHYSTQKSEKLYIDGLFLSKAYNISAKKNWRGLCVMTLKGDAKFKGKLTCGLKNNFRNLLNFHASSWKSGNLHFDGLLLSKAYKDLDEKIQKSYVS